MVLRRSFGLLLALVTISAASCGSGTDSGNPSPAHVKDSALSASLDSFSLNVSRDSLAYGGSLEGVRLSRKDTADGTELSVQVQGAQALKALYFELAYDADNYAPDAARGTGVLARGSNFGTPRTLQLSVLRDRGVVHYGEIVSHPEAADGVSGDVTLAKVKFTRGPATASRLASAAPSSIGSKSTASYVLGTNKLTWNYANQGDYDQNSEVNISDLTPLAVHLGDSSGGGSFTPDSTSYPIDGDGNGVINISDITPIGANLKNHVSHYNVYSSTDEGDVPDDASDPSTSAPIGVVNFQDAIVGPNSTPLQFEFTPPSPSEDKIYWVRPAENSDEGTPSRPDGDIVILTPETTVLGPETGIEFAAEPAPGTLQLTDPPGGTDVAPGQVLVGVYEDVGLGEFHGVLDRVLSVDSRVGDLVTATTEPATLKDVFEQAGFSKTADMLDPHLLDFVTKYPCMTTTTVKQIGKDGKPVAKPQAAGGPRYRTISADFAREWEAQRKAAKKTSASSDIHLDFSGARLYDKTDGSNYFRVTVEQGTFDWNLPGVDVDYDVGVDWCWFVPCGIDVDYVKAGVSGGIASDLVVEAQGNYDKDIDEESKLYEISDYYVFAIGPVPVVMRVTVSIFGGIKGPVHAQMFAKAGYHMAYGLAMGVIYDGDNWGTYFEPTANFSPEPPEMNASGYADLFAYLRGEVTIAFYDIAGGKIMLTPGLQGHADGSVDIPAGQYCLNWDLDGKLKGDLNLFVELFGFDIFNETWNIFDLSADITSGTIGCGSSSIPNVYFHGAVADIIFGPPPVTMTFSAGDDSLNPNSDTFDPDSFNNDGPGLKQGIKQYYWDLDGDGYCEQSTAGDVGTAQHTYDAYGNYTVNLWVVDDDGMIVKKSLDIAVIPPIG